jgi:hypothetical protein
VRPGCWWRRCRRASPKNASTRRQRNWRRISGAPGAISSPGSTSCGHWSAVGSAATPARAAKRRRAMRTICVLSAYYLRTICVLSACRQSAGPPRASGRSMSCALYPGSGARRSRVAGCRRSADASGQHRPGAGASPGGSMVTAGTPKPGAPSCSRESSIFLARTSAWATPFKREPCRWQNSASGGRRSTNVSTP